MTTRDTQIDGFLTVSGWGQAARLLVAGDASNRRYFRLRQMDGKTAILMDAPPDKGEDVLPFVQIADHLRQVGLNAPDVFASDTQLGFLILEDFGDALFANIMETNPSQQSPLYRNAADVLVHLQNAPSPQLPICDSAWLLRMLEPLFEWYAPDTVPQDIAQFNTLFRPHADHIATQKPVMILRDFHAQNLLLIPERRGLARVGILDFQDAMLGHPAYDLVSILQDARRDVDPALESEIVDYFLDQTPHKKTDFRAAYAVLGLQRNLRILGIFARLCLRDGKAQYVDYISRVWGYITRNLAHPDLAAVSKHLTDLLPPPTDTFLEHLKSQCQTLNSQP